MTFILQLWLHCPVLLKDLKQQGFRVVAGSTVLSRSVLIAWEYPVSGQSIASLGAPALRGVYRDAPLLRFGWRLPYRPLLHHARLRVSRRRL